VAAIPLVNQSEAKLAVNGFAGWQCADFLRISHAHAPRLYTALFTAFIDASLSKFNALPTTGNAAVYTGGV
jgi:hypothetical protein